MPEVLPPEVMADAVASIWQGDDWRPGLANFRAALLEPTLRRAASATPFYATRIDRSRLDGVFDAAVGDRIRHMYGLLRELPVLQRAEVREHLGELLIDDEDGRVVRTTSGSSGLPLHVLHSRDEIDYVEDVLTALEARGRPDDRPAPSRLSLFSMAHGAPPLASRLGLRLATASAEWKTEWLHAYLGSGPPLLPALDGCDPAVRVLTAGVRNLVELTQRLIDSGFDFATTGVEQITTHSHLLTRGRRAWLEATWKKPLTDRYSLTEIVGGATSCTECGGMHFDPWVVPELVEITGPRLRDGGEGRLLLTSLYPFARMQPMIRYDTGDLFRVESSRCLHDFSWFPLGRVGRSLLHGNQLLVSELDLQQAIEEVATPLFDGTGRGVPLAAGFRVVDAPATRLQVTLALDGDRASFFCDRLRAALAAGRPARADLFGALSIEVVPPATTAV